jgi:cell division protein FtsQ
VDRPAEPAARGTRGRQLSRVGMLAGAAALTAVCIAHLLARGEALRVGAIRFTGLKRASEADLLALSPVKPGDSLLAADLAAMERALLRHPWLRSAEAHRRLPPAVEVHVSEREPAALVELGGLYLLDRDAQVFKRAAAGDGLDLPLLTGFTREDYLQRRADLEPRLAGALALLDGYAREGLPALAPVSEVHFDTDGGVTLYVGEEGAQVRFGVGDLPQKLSRLHRILSALRAEGKKAEVLHLDNRNHPDWVTVRLAGNPSGDAVARAPASEAAGRGPRGP